jgi:sigma-E factor negative regulatory protein RseA
MSDRLRESVSAVLDGEADDLELRRLLASAEHQEIRAAWRDYHLHRDSLAGVDMRFAHIDISMRVQSALAEEQRPAAVHLQRWWRPLASVAVAASVAAVVAVGVRGVSVGSNQSFGTVGTEVAQAPAPSAGRVYPAQSGPVLGNVPVSAQLSDLAVLRPASANPDELAQQRLQHYLLRHTERAALNNGQGLISFARVSELSSEDSH